VKKRIAPVFILSIAITVSVIIAGSSYAIPGETLHTIELPQIRVELKPGDGLETTGRYCGICHSLDYITMQPHFPRSKWNAIVSKMIKVMGAPIGEADEKVIVDYLAAQYGTGQE
jgi:hypothetical protein